MSKRDLENYCLSKEKVNFILKFESLKVSISQLITLASLVAQRLKCLPAMQETKEAQVDSLGWEDPLKEGMATHSSTLAWRNPWREEPGRLQSMGLKESDTTEQIHFTLASRY